MSKHESNISDMSKEDKDIVNKSYNSDQSNSYESKNRSNSSLSHSKHSNSEPGLIKVYGSNNNPNPPKLDFLIFLSPVIYKTLTEKNFLKKIEEQFDNQIQMEFDQKFTIPEYYGYLLRIKGQFLNMKRDATKELLEFIVKNNLDEPENTSKSTKIEIVIIIPNGLVSMIIGTKGKQISSLIKDSEASIVINQPVYKMTYRTVSICGKPYNVSNAIMMIQKIMEDRFHEITKSEFECRPLNVKRTVTHAKFIFNYDVIDRISYKKGKSLVDKLHNELKVDISIYQDRKNRQLERKEYICSITGTIENVQFALCEITKAAKREIRSNYDGKESYSIKILINKTLITKVIGAGGCMIQEISNFSKGTSIKIMSNKDEEKKNYCYEIPVCLAGSFSSIQDASCIIIELIECFKNGGPILKNGKSLHQNIASQFINSIFTNASSEETEDEHIYTIKDRFIAKKEEASRSEDTYNQSEYIHMQNYDKYSEHSNYKKSSSNYKRRSYRDSRYNRYNESRSYSSKRSRRYSRSRSRSYSNRRRDQYKSIKNINHYDNPTFSYDDNGQIKINTYFIVPDHLVNVLFDKEGENIKSINEKTGSKINFENDVYYIY